MSKKIKINEGYTRVGQKGFNKPTAQATMRPSKPPPAPNPPSSGTGSSQPGGSRSNK